MNKQIKKFSICISLLFFISSQPARAGFWNTFTLPKEAVVSAAKKWGVQALTVTGALALTAYLTHKFTVYYMNKTNKDFTTPKDFSTETIKIESLQQQEPASCGMHALKNAQVVLDLLKSNSTENLAEAETLKDNDYFQVLYENWQPTLKRFRAKIAVKANILPQLLEKLPKDSKVYVDAKSIIGNCAEGIANLAVEHFTPHSDPYTVNKETIQTQIKALTYNKPELQTYLFENYVSKLNTLTIPITKKYIQTLYSEKTVEWLEGDEISELLDRDEKDCITILDDVNQIAFYTEKLGKSWQQSPNFLHAFIVGTMEETHSQQKGHWITIILQKNNRKKRAFVLDSVNNFPTKQVDVILNALNGSMTQ